MYVIIIIMLMVVLIKETEDNRGEIVTVWDEQKPPTHNGNPTKPTTPHNAYATKLCVSL